MHLDLRHRFRKDGKFWYVESLDYPVFSQGRSKEEAVENLVDAFLLYAQEPSAQSKYPELRRVAELYAPLARQRLEMLFFVRPRTTYEPVTNLVRDRTSENTLQGV